MANLNPCSNMTKVLEKFKVPGIDMTTMIEASRGDIEALATSNLAEMARKAQTESMVHMAERAAAQVAEFKKIMAHK
jgi:hypothetical protein